MSYDDPSKNDELEELRPRREPEAVYWRRRAIVLAALIGIIAFFAWSISALFGSDSDKSDDSASNKPEATATQTEGSPSDMPSSGETPWDTTGTEGGAPGVSPQGPNGDGTDASGETLGDGSAGSGPAGGSSTDGSGGNSADDGSDDGAGSRAQTGGSGPGNGSDVASGQQLPGQNGNAKICSANDVFLNVTTDAKRYFASGQPVFTFEVKNRGNEGCIIDVGSKAVELVVTSGQSRMWSSDDCQKDPQQNLVILPAGKTASSKVTWDRKTSTPGCSGRRTAAPGTYAVTGKIGPFSSEAHNFVLD